MPLSFNSELYLKFRSTNALCFVKNPAASGGALKPRTTPTADQTPHDDTEYIAVLLPP